MMRASLCVPRSTNFNAVLVRLGMMPLHYRLAFRAMSTFYRIHSERTGPAMQELLEDFQKSASGWVKTFFLVHAHNNIAYFQSYSEDNILEAPTARSFSNRLQKAMYSELTHQWQLQSIAAHTKMILPKWEPFKFFKRPVSKEVEVWFMRCCFSQNFTLAFKQKCNPQKSDTCRGCNAASETVSHILLECPVATNERKNLSLKVSELSLRNLLGNPEAMQATESFIASSKLHKIFHNL